LGKQGLENRFASAKKWIAGDVAGDRRRRQEEEEETGGGGTGSPLPLDIKTAPKQKEK